MRNLTWISLVVVVAACGPGLQPPISRPQPLTNCDTLDRASCSARTDCQVEQLACAAICQDDGHGGCVPCNGFRCIAVTPAACSTLDETSCTARSDCRLEHALGACPPCDPSADGRFACPQCVSPAPRCVDATPPACGSLDITTCGTRADCHVERSSGGSTGFANPEGAPIACPALCTTDANGVTSCVSGPCDVSDSARCVPNAPAACEALDVNACSSRADCHLESSSAADVACPQSCTTDSAGNTVCSGGCAFVPPTDHCVSNAPMSCESLDANTCTQRADCSLETPPCVATCTVDSLGNRICTTCDATPRCVTARPVDTCSGLDANACNARPDCSLESLACAAVCIDDGNGGCVPCDPAVICMPRIPPSPCAGLDETTCNADQRCEFMTWACTQECRDDGQGGCLPCVAPPSSCQERPTEPPVAGCGSGGQQPPGP
jgi:hypothetical protein